ncbi:MAG: hypothetical protein PHO42_01760 [Candidatus Omnitrophica bacterium]|nr:hypothetical protein [Candidatus Omnitrophota bacterium]
MKTQKSKVKRQNQKLKVKSFNFYLVVFTFSFLVFTFNCYAEPVYVDHFEKTTNLLGGRTSVYEQAPSRALALTTDKDHYGAGTRSLAIRYDKKNTGGPNGMGGWCGYYSILKTGSKYFDATSFTKLTFWVRGEKGDENFVVGMADRHWEQVGDSVKSEQIGVYLKDKKITTQWQQAVIPLDVFFIDMKEVASLAICFESDCFPEGKGTGTVYIDEIAFE